MKQKTEKPQQINDLEIDCSSVRDTYGVNGTGTESKSDAPLTQVGSLDVLARALAREHPSHP